MAKRIFYTISTGERYGRLRVIGKGEKSKSGHQLYICQCVCGSIHSYMSAFLRSHNDVKCGHCAAKEMPKKKTIPIIGKRFGCWEVVSEAGYNEKRSVWQFNCQCLNCGTEKIKTSGGIRSSKMGKCSKCPSEIKYEINGATAIGILPDGTRFLFDAERLPDVEGTFWQFGGKYIRSRLKGWLHHYLLGTGTDVMVDHINRDKMDYRLVNLRTVTPQQNSANRDILSSNKTGYVGVRWYPAGNKYRAEIKYNGICVSLGYYHDISLAAQAYNIAADLLFGEYRGHVNEVSEPDVGLIADITERCHKRLGSLINYGGEADAKRRNQGRRRQAKEAIIRKTA